MAQLTLVFLLAFGIAQALLLILYLCNKRSKTPANFYLLLLLLVFSLQILVKIISKSWLMDHILLVYKLSYILPLLTGPLLLYFTYAATQEKWTFRWQDGFHLVPFIISLLALINFIFFPYNDVALRFMPSYRLGHLLELGVQLMSLGLYMWWSLQLAKDSFLRNFIFITSSLSISTAIGFKFLYLTHPLYYEWRWTFILLTLYIYWVTYLLLQNRFDFNISNKKYNNSGLTPADLILLQKKLQQLMETQQPYLNSQLNIEALARQLHISRHHLSQVLNEGLQKTYHDFVNEYRIEAAKQLLHNPQKQHYSIAAIAFEAGFNSLSSFNQVFKKHCQLTPSEFRQQANYYTKIASN
ncbi:MAG: helix-turn-helix domain-containing protein [Saprospiraceae bacterium]